MNAIDEDLLNEMNEQVDLLEYAEQFCDFKKTGTDSFVTNCPSHIDKTPSLFITPSKNVFFCQSCHKGGYGAFGWMLKYEHLSYNESVDKLSRITGTQIKDLKRSETLKFYKDVKKVLEHKTKDYIREPLKYEDYLKFSDDIPQEWVDEGISPEIMKLYQIRIDYASNRIVYPVYDANLNFISAKGRTRFLNYKDLGIMKYINFSKIGTTDFLTGMREAQDSIKKHDEIIVVEGIKSCMKIRGYGYPWVVSSETSCLNDEQIKLILQTKVKNVVVAFDNDVSWDKALESVSKLKKFINVYIVTDRQRKADKLLPQNKMSPCDAGKEVWEILYRERKKV